MNYKIILAVMVGLIVAVLLLTDVQDSLLGSIVERYAEPDWDDIAERDIVKSSVPITLVSQENQQCLVRAEHFFQIIEHDYFSRAGDISNELQYDASEKTLVVSCDKITQDQMKLHVWYIIDEAASHAGKYRYFITD